MTAAEVKRALYARHPGHAGQMPGAWTCIEELHGIDLVAFSAWSSAGKYARVGYEVKVSRSDYRRELLRPYKRERNVSWCNEFYFAVPAGLLTADEIAFEEPEWVYDDFQRERCPNADDWCQMRRVRCAEDVPVPTTGWVGRAGFGDGWQRIPCRTCGGSGKLGRSRVEQEAPTLWVPRDVGLIVVNGRGTSVAKASPKRKEVPAVERKELGQIVRWISMRPDPRHHAKQRPAPEQLPVF